MLRLAVAVFLNMMLPGVGQFVNGQRIKGAVLLGADLLLLLLMRNTLGDYLRALIQLISLVDAVVVAIQIHKGKRAAPAGRPLVIEVLIVTVVAFLLTWGAEVLATNGSNPGNVWKIPRNQSENKQEQEKIKREAEAYFEQKYGKKFKVTQVDYTWQTGEYTLYGHPVDEPGKKVMIMETMDGFIDSYFASKMSDDVENELKPVMDRIYPRNVTWTAFVGIDPEDQIPYAKEVSSFKELRSKMNRYSVDITVYEIRDLDGGGKQAGLQAAYELISYLNKNQIQANLEIQYYDDVLLSRGVSKVDFNTQDDYHDALRYILLLNVNQLKTVQSPADLEKYLNEVKH